MAINSQNKGKNYEREIAHKLSKVFNCDVRRVPCSGALDIKGDLRNLSGVLENYVFELKKQEKMNIWKCLQQTFRQAGHRVGVLIFSRNHERDYICMDLNDWIVLVQRAEGVQGE